MNYSKTLKQVHLIKFIVKREHADLYWEYLKELTSGLIAEFIFKGTTTYCEINLRILCTHADATYLLNTINQEIEVSELSTCLEEYIHEND